jgi:hypothetical protein
LQLTVAVVREELFRRANVVERLCRDFALPAHSSADELARSLVAAFGQVSAANAGSTPFAAVDCGVKLPNNSFPLSILPLLFVSSAKKASSLFG